VNTVVYWEDMTVGMYVEYLVCVVGRTHWKAVSCSNFFNSLLQGENKLIALISLHCVSDMFSTKHFNTPSNTTTCLLFKNSYMFQS